MLSPAKSSQPGAPAPSPWSPGARQECWAQPRPALPAGRACSLSRLKHGGQGSHSHGQAGGDGWGTVGVRPLFPGMLSPSEVSSRGFAPIPRSHSLGTPKGPFGDQSQVPAQAPQRARGQKSPGRAMHLEGWGSGTRQLAGTREPPSGQTSLWDKFRAVHSCTYLYQRNVLSKPVPRTRASLREKHPLQRPVRERGWQKLHLSSVAPWQCPQGQQPAPGKAGSSARDTPEPAVPMGRKVCVHARGGQVPPLAGSRAQLSPFSSPRCLSWGW